MGDFMKTYKITRTIRHGSEIASLYFHKPFEINPGQFINLWLPKVDEKPFSVSDATGDFFEITIKAVGPFTRKILNLREGDYLGIRGPFGNGFPIEDGGLLVGGGMGIAPLRYLAKTLRKNKMKFASIFGVKKASDMIFLEEYASDPDFMLTSEDGKSREKVTASFYRGLVTEFVHEMLRKRRLSRIFAVGPEPMLLELRKTALNLGIPCHLSFERYMKCGIGICGQCCLDGSGIRLCVEGPVLSEPDMAKVTEFGLPRRNAAGRRPDSKINRLPKLPDFQ